MLVIGGILVLATAMTMAAPAKKGSSASTSDKWLHVRVQDGTGSSMETVHVNVPLALAEAVVPAIKVDRLHDGKVHLEDGDLRLQEVDFRQILQALRDTKDGNFVTVEGNDNIRVAKQGGFLIAKVQEGGSGSKVDARLPMAVVEALFTGEKNELNLLAAIRALGEHGDGVLVTVDDKDSKVRIWVDSQNETGE
jgi:hypothetical protein